MTALLEDEIADLSKLIVSALDGTRREYEIKEGRLTIGRSPKCRVCLNDSQVSWTHAVLIRDASGIVIEDLKSTNGTFFRSQRVHTQTLDPGARVKIGPFDLELSAHAAPSPSFASENTLFASSGEIVHRLPRRSKQFANPSFPEGPTESLQALAAHATRMRRSTLGWLHTLTWLTRYRRADLRFDAVAGLTVAATMVPQGMAYALLAGLPPAMGLYASILPMIVYALTGTGRHTSVAPVTVDSLMVVLGLSAMAAAASSSYLSLAILLTALVGVVQISMGLLRLGFIVNFLSYPVLAGFTGAIAIVTVLAQLKNLLGITQPQHASLYQSAFHLIGHVGEANGITLAIGLGCCVALFALRRCAPKAPAPLILAITGTAIAYFFDLEEYGVHVLGEIPSALPTLGMPSVQWHHVQQLMPLALALALVGFAQTISAGKSLGNKHGYDIDANRELGALGLANLSSSVSHGYVVSGSLARSSLNASSGAQTQLAMVFTALSVVATILFITPLFRYLPQVTLAAILIMSAIRLIDVAEISYLFKVKVTEGLLLVFTLAATLTLGIMEGLVLGIVASVLLFIALNTRPYTPILGRLPHTNIFRNVEHFPEAETFPGLVILRIDASLYFANVVFLKKRIRDVCRQHAGELKALILDASAVNDLDSSADAALHQLSSEFKRMNIAFYVAGIKAPVREVMMRSGLYDALGGDHFFFTIEGALKRFQERSALDAIKAGASARC